MPNWCENELRVQGDPEQLAEFKEKTRGSVNGQEVALSLDALVPMPRELLEVSSPTVIVSEEEYSKKVEETARRMRESGLAIGLPITRKMSDDYKARFGADNWYDWRLKNWNTKWNAAGAVLHEDADSLTYKFDTAWSPPVLWLRTVSKQFPKLTFRLEYVEEGMNFDGAVTFRNGDEPDEE